MQTQTFNDTLFESRRQEHLAEIRQLFSGYMQRPDEVKEDLFLSFSEWEGAKTQKKPGFSLAEHKLLFGPSEIDEQKGGYFLRLEETGIVFNPGNDFFERLFQQGFTLFDIDLVIASSNGAATKQVLSVIHALNRELNRTLLSYEQEPHVIRFLLHPELYSEISAELRPEYRQERHSVIALETYAGTSDEESYAIDKDLTLYYTNTQEEAIALRLETKKASIGLLTGAGWQEKLKRFFASCTIMLSGIGKTPAEDLEMVTLQTGNLGYFGLCQMLHALPGLELVLLSEFSRQDGDIRLELIKKLTQEQESQAKILPLDSGFCLSLDRLTVATANNKSAHYQEVSVVRAEGAFAKLLYVAKDDLI